MSSPKQSFNLSPSIEELYARVQRELKNADPDIRAHEVFDDFYLQVIRSIRSADGSRLNKSYLQSLLLPFDPAPWKTQLDSLSALITSIRIALLARLLVMKQNAGFTPLTRAMPVHGFFESRVNKRNAP